MNPTATRENSPEEREAILSPPPHNQPMPTFLGLPVELRIEIYTYTFADLAAHLRCDSTARALLRPIWKPHTLALTQVCAQVRAETQAVPKVCTDLRGHVGDLWDYLMMPGGVLSSWELNALTTVRMEVNGYEYAKYEMLALHVREVLEMLAHCSRLKRVVIIPNKTTCRITGPNMIIMQLIERNSLAKLNHQFRQMCPQSRIEIVMNRKPAEITVVWNMLGSEG